MAQGVEEMAVAVERALVMVAVFQEEVEPQVMGVGLKVVG